MAHGLGQLFTKTMTTGSGGSLSVDLGRTFNRVFVQCVAPGAAVDLQGSLDNSTFKALGFGHLTATSGTCSYLSTHSNLIREIQGGLQYYKLINTTATGAGEVVRIWGSDL